MSKTVRTIANTSERTPAFLLEPGDHVVHGNEVHRITAVNIAGEKETEITWATVQFTGYGEDFDAVEYVDPPFIVSDRKLYNVIRVLKVKVHVEH